MDKRGSTLIEVLLILFLLGLVVHIAFSLIFQIQQISFISDSYYDISRVAQSILEEIKALNSSIIKEDRLILERLFNNETVLYIDTYEVKLSIYQIEEKSPLYWVNINIKKQGHNLLYILNSYILDKDTSIFNFNGHREISFHLNNLIEE